MALAPSAPGARPPKSTGATHLTFTLRIQTHGITLRTVDFQRSVPLTAADFQSFLKHGYWDVGLLGDGIGKSKLCGLSMFCTDDEPGHEAAGAPFNNLSAKSPAGAKTGLQHTVVLDGTMPIDRRGAITEVFADFNLCPSGCSSPGFLIDTPKPVALAAGQSVHFTIHVSLSRRGG